MITLDDAILHCKDRAKEDCSECAKEHQQLAEWLEELKAYKDLEEQGKMLKFPVAIGDTVYSFSCSKIITLRVESFMVYANGTDIWLVENEGEHKSLRVNVEIEEFWQKCFLTKEEALLKALKS